MKRQQKKYNTRLDIDRDILKLRRKVKTMDESIASIDKDIGILNVQRGQTESLGGSTLWHEEQIDSMKRKKQKICKSINNILQERIPQLGRTKAALMTPDMFGEKGVVIEP